MDSGHFELFLNCLTIYFILWLRDILGVCRSGCRSGLLNCVGILYNFGVGILEGGVLEVRIRGVGFCG